MTCERLQVRDNFHVHVRDGSKHSRTITRTCDPALADVDCMLEDGTFIFDLSNRFTFIHFNIERLHISMAKQMHGTITLYNNK